MEYNLEDIRRMEKEMKITRIQSGIYWDYKCLLAEACGHWAWVLV